jgi:uncharacterized phage protein (TIGR01671 family)
MREIKFRAWYHIGADKTIGAMQYSPRYINNTWYVLDTNGEWKESNCVELMQFTGLKDKNGKEIYEGDIVKYDFAGEYIEEVKWGNWKDEQLGGSGFALPYFFREGEDCEVIGNVWENPELLEKQK